MNVLVILFYLLTKAFCVDVHLPYIRSDHSPFKYDVLEVSFSNYWRHKGIIFKSHYVVPTSNVIINRVFYNGYLLYNYTGDGEPRPDRAISYNEFRGRAYVAVHKNGTMDYDTYLYIANDIVYDLLNLKTLINDESGKIDGMSPGLFLVHNYDSLIQEDGPYSEKHIILKCYGILHTGIYVTTFTIRHDVDKIFEDKILKRSEPYDRIFDVEYIHNVVENE